MTWSGLNFIHTVDKRKRKDLVGKKGLIYSDKLSTPKTVNTIILNAAVTLQKAHNIISFYPLLL